MVIEVRMSWGRTWSELSTTSTHCNIESGVIGSDALNPVYCVLDRNNGRLLIYTKVYCYYEQGSHTGYGTPIRIYVTDFTVPSNKIIPLRILLTNSDISDVFPRFIFKAFGGSYSAPELMGDEFMGIFQVK